MVLEEENWVSGVALEALLGVSGSTFWVLGQLFGSRGDIFKVRWIFFFNMYDFCSNLYQPLLIPISLYINLFQALLLSLNR